MRDGPGPVTCRAHASTASSPPSAMPDSIPTLAVDQFAATLATWFGADSNALATVLPNLSAFSPTTLGFIEPHARRRRKPRTPFPISGRTLKKSRSEEHTSELQSQSNLVCRLLLEKKKKKKKKNEH